MLYRYELYVVQKILDIFKDTLFEARCLKIDDHHIAAEDMVYRDEYQTAGIPETMKEIRREK